MTQKWYEKASVQATIVGGLLTFIGVLAAVTSNLYIENRKLHEQFRAQIEQTLSVCTKEIMDAQREALKVDIRPDFSSPKAAAATLQRVNEEAEIFFTRINISAINNSVRLYGTVATNTEFGEKLNAHSRAHDNLSFYTLSVVETLNSSSSQHNFRHMAQAQYFALLTERNSRRQEFLDFLGNLTTNAFTIP